MRLVEMAMASVIGVGSALPFYRNIPVAGGGGGGGFLILLENGNTLAAEDGSTLRQE